MTQYRRNRIAGGTYFFTVAVFNRTNGPLITYIADLRAAFRIVRAEHPFEIEAIVILPDHLHAMWTLPSGDSDYAIRWKKIKANFSMRIPDNEPRSASRAAKGERGIWQRRYWEHTIRDDDDFRAHCDYIHFNPVKHGYAQAAGDWPHSTFQRFVERGSYPMDWGGLACDKDDFGECWVAYSVCDGLHPSYGCFRRMGRAQHNLSQTHGLYATPCCLNHASMRLKPSSAASLR